jgi:hypothetical protein
VEDEGNGLRPPAHCAGIALNVGVTFGVIVTWSVAVLAHCPAVGVNVYVVVALGLKAGDHVPVIAGVLVEDEGNGLLPPSHCAGIALNVGVTFGVIVTWSVAVLAHCPAVGVNV